MALVVDGVAFQLAQPDAARFWRTLLPMLKPRLDMPVVFLDRGGGGCEAGGGTEVVPFPSYKPKFNPQDSALLERFCRHYGAKVFVSTCHTTPLQTPSLVVIADMIPERLGSDLSGRDRQEKELAIAHARRHLCLSHDTRKDLLEFYPELDPARVSAAHRGADTGAFGPDNWEPFADELARAVAAVAQESASGVLKAFYEKWARLRRLQGEVDVLR